MSRIPINSSALLSCPILSFKRSTSLSITADEKQTNNKSHGIAITNQTIDCTTTWQANLVRSRPAACSMAPLLSRSPLGWSAACDVKQAIDRLSMEHLLQQRQSQRRGTALQQLCGIS